MPGGIQTCSICQLSSHYKDVMRKAPLYVRSTSIWFDNISWCWHLGSCCPATFFVDGFRPPSEDVLLFIVTIHSLTLDVVREAILALNIRFGAAHVSVQQTDAYMFGPTFVHMCGIFASYWQKLTSVLKVGPRASLREFVL